MKMQVRRGILILLASLAVAVVVLQLGELGWADRLRAHEQERQQARDRYVRTHKNAGRRPDRPPSTSERYLRGFEQVVVAEIGLPCAATLGLLAYTRRKRTKPGPSHRLTP